MMHLLCKGLIAYSLIIIWIAVLFFSCDRRENIVKSQKLFSMLTPTESGIQFTNTLTENDSMNIFKYGYMYMGGGVAIGDVNNDGLDDLYLTGNMVRNKLYLNKGGMKFEDITDIACVATENQWCTGVTMVDVNADGWLDIYVSVSGIWVSKKNLLYVNQGIHKDGIPIFKEKAIDFGLADEGQSVQATFFDYDNDNDLDVYIVNYPVTSFRTTPKQYSAMMDQVTDQESNTLYRNNGDHTFTNMTEKAGVKSFGLSLSAAISDYNNDGLLDIYVSNDFATPDNFYFNNGDGTFTDQIKQTVNQASFFGMGTDAADFNNDGLIDLFQLDMSTSNNRRSKVNMQSMNIGLFQMMEQYDFHTQYMENSLQLNIGNTENNLPHFSNIARLAKVSLSDWSWASLFADLDNDGLKDIFVTNGTRKEVNNKDYLSKINKKYKDVKYIDEISLVELVNQMPSEKIGNYAFRNNGDLTFTDNGDGWGLDTKGFSNGTAYADLDNDGDLDIVTNDIDSEAKIFRNNANENTQNNSIKISFKGGNNNPNGIGARVTIFTDGALQLQELMLSRGFQSSVPPYLHFGLGNHKKIDSLEVLWPDGKIQKLKDLAANNIVLDSADAKSTLATQNSNLIKTFKDATSMSKLRRKHIENYFDDYDYQILLPHKMSQEGPALAVADVNNDGLDDFFVGGAMGYMGAIYQQNDDGTFKKLKTHKSWRVDKNKEDVGAVFFDANDDGRLDLYVVSGGNEFYKNTRAYQDRLYINTKDGFVKSKNALPQLFESGSKAVPADYDNDGDLDLFVGGLHTPRNYPLPTSSTILRNDSKGANIKFVNVTKEIAPELIDIGMVTDALWTDFNDDDTLDLIIVGQWMPLTFLENRNGKFKNVTEELGMQNTTGWWFSIKEGDFDNDGDTDYIAGNLGLNYKYQASEEESFDIYAADFDNNKSTDIVLGYYYDGEQYPVRGRQCSSQQIPAIEVKFRDYNSFAIADLADVYSTQSLENALHYKARNFSTSYIENLGNEQFKLRALPHEAQVSSVNSILTKDINNDGNLDLILSGNLYGSEVETPRNDASYGLYLEGDGNGNFISFAPYKSGLYVKGEVKNSEWIKLSNGEFAILFAKNNDYLQLYTKNTLKLVKETKTY